jgi:hypothetical protein
VDDICVTAATHDIYKIFFKELSASFKCSDLGQLEFYTGISVQRSGAGFHLGQAAYVEKIVSKYEVTGVAHWPSCSGAQEEEGQAYDVEPELITPMRQLVGSIMYAATSTRPDIAFSVSVLARSMDRPTLYHINAARRVISYLNTTKDLGILICPPSNSCTLGLSGYSDADFAADADTRRSTTGFIIRHNDNIILWKSVLQKSVSLSSCESEYRALSECCREVVCIRGLCKDMMASAVRVPIPIYVDNRAAIILAGGSDTLSVVYFHSPLSAKFPTFSVNSISFAVLASLRVARHPFYPLQFFSFHLPPMSIQ